MLLFYNSLGLFFDYLIAVIPLITIMADGVKSTLVLGQHTKKETEKTAADNADI